MIRWLTGLTLKEKDGLRNARDRLLDQIEQGEPMLSEPITHSLMVCETLGYRHGLEGWSRAPWSDWNHAQIEAYDKGYTRGHLDHEKGKA